MANRPVVPSETHKRRKEARDKLAIEVNDAVEVYIKTLNNLVVKYAQCVTSLPFGNEAIDAANFSN